MPTSLKQLQQAEAGELHGDQLIPATEETAPGDPTPSSRTGRGKRGVPPRRRPTHRTKPDVKSE